MNKLRNNEIKYYNNISNESDFLDKYDNFVKYKKVCKGVNLNTKLSSKDTENILLANDFKGCLNAINDDFENIKGVGKVIIKFRSLFGEATIPILNNNHSKYCVKLLLKSCIVQYIVSSTALSSPLTPHDSLARISHHYQCTLFLKHSLL